MQTLYLLIIQWNTKYQPALTHLLLSTESSFLPVDEFADLWRIIERPSELYWGPFFLVFTLSFLKGRLYLGASGATDPEPSKPWSFTSKIGYFSMKLPFILVLNFTSIFLPKSNVVQWKKCEGYFSCSPVHIWIDHINTWPTQLCAFI